VPRTRLIRACVHLFVGVTVRVYLVAVLPAQGGMGPRHLESFSENFECGRRGMCAQIKERKVKEKQSKERGWRVREIMQIYTERGQAGSASGEDEVEGG